MNCPHCQQELPENHAENRCPSCGCDSAAWQTSTDNKTAQPDKGTYWPIFWLAFLGSPILVFMAAAVGVGGGILFVPIIGALVAGFSLAKIYTKTPAALIAVGIVFAIAVLVIYVGIIFVGCLVIMGHGGF